MQKVHEDVKYICIYTYTSNVHVPIAYIGEKHLYVHIYMYVYFLRTMN